VIVLIGVSLMMRGAPVLGDTVYNLIADPGLSDGFAFSGTVTTDGSTGFFTDASAVIDWSVTLVSPAATYLFTPGDSGFLFFQDTALLNITATSIQIPVTTGGAGSSLFIQSQSGVKFLRFTGARAGVSTQSIAGVDFAAPITTGGFTYPGEAPLVVATLAPTPLSGDLDGDGFVGINDLNIVLGAWNQAVPPGDPLADPSGDGFVGIDDLNTVLGNWNAGTPPPGEAGVPEPTSLGVLALGGLTLIRWR